MLDEAMTLLPKMKENDCLPDLITYKMLLGALLVKREIDKAENLLHVMIDSGDELYFFFFSDVDDSKDTWSVVGKVLRKWVVRIKAAPYAVWKVGMLLADEKGSRIEVSQHTKISLTN
ncbi:hypothetical protein K1719_007280 [Acacia pycnantha]|nr:hypothetical protein K1719_007280 [Acacia pycnantha]